MKKPPVLSTITVGMIAERVAHLAAPWVEWIGHWVMAHSTIVFPATYMNELDASFQMAVVGLAIWWHIAEPAPAPDSPAVVP